MNSLAGPTLMAPEHAATAARAAPPAHRAPLGNQALLRRLQPKLTIGAVEDPLEHEADAVAEQVMRMPAGMVPQISRKCAACEEEEKLQPKAEDDFAGGSEAPGSVDQALRSAGQPLDPGLRDFFEPRFGADFGNVRVHHDATAAASARDVGARAYAVGKDLVFADGAYAPSEDQGRQLIAHELTHVVQQGEAKIPQVRRDAAPPDPAAPDPAAPDTSATPPSGSIDITEDLFTADAGGGGENSGQVQMLRRQPADIPPPPPAYPAATQWFFDVSAGTPDFASLFGMTCQDGLERGFFVMWNETTNKSYAGPVEIGDPAKGCEAAHIQLGPVPADKKPIYPVGWFHTHPLANAGCRKTGVGPSALDQQTSKSTGLPGLVYDTKTPQGTCHDGGYFFFGPSVRS